MYILYVGTATITRQILGGGGGGGARWKWVVSETHSTTYAYARRRLLLRLKKLFLKLPTVLSQYRMDIIDTLLVAHAIA